MTKKTNRRGGIPGVDYLASRREWDPRYQKGPNYVGARDFDLLSPKGVRYTGRSLLNFVHTHEHLFDARLVEWKTFPKSDNLLPQCLASRGLAQLNPNNKNTVRAWHGWRWYVPEPELESILKTTFVVSKSPETSHTVYLRWTTRKGEGAEPLWVRSTMESTHFATIESAKLSLRRVCRRQDIPYNRMNVTRIRIDCSVKELSRHGPFSWSWKTLRKGSSHKILVETTPS